MLSPIKKLTMVAVLATSMMSSVAAGDALAAEKHPTGASQYERLPAHWFKTGSKPTDYEVGLDRAVSKDGRACVFIKSPVNNPREFGTVMQDIDADQFRGHRVRLVGTVKTDNVKQWAGLWMRVDGAGKKQLSFDNMWQRPIKGTTEWKQYEVILPVPPESEQIAFGVLLSGAGQAWVKDLKVEKE